MFKKLTALVVICAMSLFGYGDVLLWTIDSSSFVDDTPMSVFVSPLQEDDENWAVGRVKVTTGAGVVKYLDLYAPSGDINVVGETYPGAEGVWIGGGGEFYGTGGEVQGVLSSDVDASALFAIEIGMNHWIDDGTEEGRIDFELLAITNPHTYEQLQEFMYQQQDINPLDLHAWNPTYYHTPEPSTSLLCIIGLGVLMLKRKPCHG